MTEPASQDRKHRRTRHEPIRAQVAEKEAEAAKAEVAEEAVALDAPLHLHIDKELDAELRRRAADAYVPTSGWSDARCGKRCKSEATQSRSRRWRTSRAAPPRGTPRADGAALPGSQIGSQRDGQQRIAATVGDQRQGPDLLVCT